MSNKRPRATAHCGECNLVMITDGALLWCDNKHCKQKNVKYLKDRLEARMYVPQTEPTVA